MDLASVDTAFSNRFVEWCEDSEHEHVRGLLGIPEFRTEAGERLTNAVIRFETWGRLNAAADNAVVICHALTGDAHAADSSAGPGWWSGLIGPGRLVDTRRYYVIATNVLGGCAGSSGPASQAPDGLPYGLRFPLVTIRDMVRAQLEVVRALGVREVYAVIGGSMGGMQTWEWPLLFRGRVRQAVVIAAQAAFTPLGIGYNYAMRQAITADADWHGGNYYAYGTAPVRGMAAARSIGMLTYRTEALFEERFRREVVPSASFRPAESGWTVDGSREEQHRRQLAQPCFQSESYLQHQGDVLNERFDANSYLYLTRAMDSHDIGRGRGGLAAALSQFDAALTVVGIDQDYLYSVSHLQQDVALAASCGVRARYLELKSAYGHDAFLADQAQLAACLGSL